MTPAEFKAWFEGFSEGIDGAPSAKQWEKVRERVKSIVPPPANYPVYIERYYPAWPHTRYYSPFYPQWQYLSQNQGVQASQNQCSNAANPFVNQANVANALRQNGNPQGLTLDQMRAQCSQLQQTSLDGDYQRYAEAAADGFRRPDADLYERYRQQNPPRALTDAEAKALHDDALREEHGDDAVEVLEAMREHGRKDRKDIN